jgi:hypothetical protein
LFIETHGTQQHRDCHEFLVAKGYQLEEGYSYIKATWKAGK